MAQPSQLKSNRRPTVYPSPAFLQIAQELMQQVESGILQRGTRTASSATLAKKLRVSTLTVEKAYEWLEACGTLTRDSTTGWRVSRAGERTAPSTQESGEARIARFVDETLRAAAKYGLDPTSFADKAMRRAVSMRERVRIRNLVFVACHPEYISDFVEELRRGLSDLDVKVSGVLTSLTTGSVDRRRSDSSLIAQAEYILTTNSRAEFVRGAVANPGDRVIAMSYTLGEDGLYKIVSLRKSTRLGAIFGANEIPDPVVRTLEYYRDQPAGSIPHAFVNDPRAVEKVLAETDVVTYTQPCQGEKSTFQKPGRDAILLRFVPDKEAIAKIRALLAATALEPVTQFRRIAAK
jgi:DNA-binding transcriptional regulator YhcF (GntR family)